MGDEIRNVITREHEREIEWMIDAAVENIVDYINMHRLDIPAAAEVAEKRVKWKLQ